MTRTVISIDAEDKAWLDGRVAGAGVPMTEIVRQAGRRHCFFPLVWMAAAAPVAGGPTGAYISRAADLTPLNPCVILNRV